MTTYASYLKGLEGRLGRGPTSLRSTDVVVIVDLQCDFVPHAHGAGTPSSFGVRGGEQIVRPVCDLVSTMLKARGSVVCTRDYHPASHASFKKNGGLFPMHCVQGTPGAELVPRLAEAITDSDGSVRDRVHIVFKGMDKTVDSFGAAAYKVENRGCHSAACLVRSGSFRLPCSGHHVHDQAPEFPGLGTVPGSGSANAPPDVGFQPPDNKERLERLPCMKAASRIFVVGLALDFCVVDTANNLATALPHAKVSILLDMCRPAFLDGAFLTPPDAFLKRATRKVTLVSHKRSFPRPRPPSKTRRYGFRSKSPHSPRR